MIKVGLVGMGGMGWFHAARYFQIEGVRLAAVADVRPERLDVRNAVQINIENKAGLPDLDQVQRYASAAELLAEADVDVVDICLPTDLHAATAIQALGAGRHVLCEKPMALTVKDADAMLAAADAAGRTLMIAQCIRFWPEYAYLKQVVRDGTFGRLLALNLVRVGGRPSGWGWQNWFMDPARSGGTLYDLHIHDVDFVYSLLGSPRRILASGRRVNPAAACEVIQTVFTYADGPQVSIQAGWSEVQIPFRAGYEAWFERGFVRYDPGAKPAIMVYDDPDRKNERPAPYSEGDAYLNEIRYFLDCVRDGRQPLECLPESARASLVLLERIRESIRSEER